MEVTGTGWEYIMDISGVAGVDGWSLRPLLHSE